MMLEIIAITIYTVMFFAALFTAYLYAMSIDGIVRKIMIKKYLAFSGFLFVVLLLSILGNYQGLRIASLACLPYLYFKIQLILHFVNKKG
jgi:hypothetical protein